MIGKILYETLKFFATWLQQPTLVEVADGIEVMPLTVNRESHKSGFGQS